MKIFNWFQSSKNGMKEKKCLQKSSLSPPSDPEYRNWPQGLLAIGTLSTNPLKPKEENGTHHDPPPSVCSHVASDFTMNEVILPQKKLSKLLTQAPKSGNINGSRTGKDVDGDIDGVEAGVDGRLSPESTVMILKKARELISGGGDDDRKSYNELVCRRRKSFGVLLKNMFICRGGFGPTPCFRDPILVSRMEKLLRIILYKNIFPQTSDSTELRKYLENKANDKATDKDINEEQENRDCKWDKTDSDFIVLEM